jgi:hypothetical protein
LSLLSLDHLLRSQLIKLPSRAFFTGLYMISCVAQAARMTRLQLLLVHPQHVFHVSGLDLRSPLIAHKALTGQSLERMVMDLGRDYYHMSPSELNALGDKIKAGDMEDVLRVYEKELSARETAQSVPCVQ